MRDWLIDILGALFIFGMFLLLTNLLFGAIAEGGTLSIHLDTGIAKDAKICFQDAAETPGPPPQPVCQYVHEDITPPQYEETNILVYIEVAVEKVTLSDAILVLRTLSGINP